MHVESDFTCPPRRRSAGLALIRSDKGRVLLVEKAYKRGADRFGLVGGSARPGEHAAAACRREVFEETGLLLVPGALLVVHWMPANGEVKEGTNHVFDCGTVPEDTRIVLPEDELVDYLWVFPEYLSDIVAPYTEWRIKAALEALGGAPVRYLVGHPEANGTVAA
ncbi:NUDIX domain-containing protein [Streptomyces sp. URMC 129]|uniref:NUDIX domain-containing protein n=1 Tax=Streptomyces sp. URMC 129 TaxID=3423407 RepID=UPI003F1B30DB